MSELSTIYIISKGRPQCHTARELVRMKYPGEWFIVCGNNDDTVDQYRHNWGDEHVLVFDWYTEIAYTDTLDNFGFDTMPSGAVPVRNATAEISCQRGERRHWQFDDDYVGFYCTNPDLKKKHRMDGEEFCHRLEQVAKFADRGGLVNCGISLTTMESVPNKAKTFGRRVFNAHNMPSGGPLFQRWRGRMNDDLINAMDVWRTGGYELSFKHLSLCMAPTQSESGGLTDLYQAEGTVRKTAYAILANPGAAKLKVRFGRYHHIVDWDFLTPKLLRVGEGQE